MKKDKLLNEIIKILESFSRESYVLAFFIWFWFILTYKVFSYSVLNYDFYSELANRQQTSQIEVPVTRWAIYSSNQIWNVLATSVDLNDLAIDPQIDWDKTKLSNFLTDIVYKQTCYLKGKNDCYRNLRRFLWLVSIDDFNLSEDYIKDKIKTKVKEKVNKQNVTSVLLRDNLRKDQTDAFSLLNLAWVYVNETHLYVNPEEVIDKKFVAEKISSVTHDDADDIEYLIRKRAIRYVNIINKLSIWLSDEIKEMISEEKSLLDKWFIKKSEMIWSFIILEPHSQRYYPESYLASQIVWFVDNQWEGHYGIEWYFNNLLRWKKWKMYSKKDTLWRVIDPFSLEEEITVAWAKITTTIDRNIQKAVEEILESWVKEFQANKWSVIIMNPKTWAIIAMANYPSFDPNSPGEVYEIERVINSNYRDVYSELVWKWVLVVDNESWEDFYYKWEKLLLRKSTREELADPLIRKYKYKNDFWAWVYKNDIISSLYEPGSIMKPVIVAIWLDIWEIKPGDMYEDKWFVIIDNFKIKNVDEECLWYHSFQHALNYSCNVWMIRVIQKIWKALVYEYLDSFGFWKLSSITLDGEVFWKIPPYEKWSRAKLFTTSFGQWITATQLQMAVSYSILANGWIYMQPYIVESIEFEDAKKVFSKKEAKHRVIKESSSKTITNMLVDSVKNWVAKLGWVKWYNIAWKTWTSQIAYRWKYEKGNATTIWSYAWYAPAEDPKFVMVVKLERPRTNQYGWATSAKLFSRISEFLFNYYAIPKKSDK